MKSLHEAPDVATACGLVLNRYLSALTAREPGTRDGKDIEDLHMMRVALRKLRAALTVFRGAINKTARTAVEDELNWLGDALGDIRDLDVFLDRMAVTRSELDEVSAQALREVDRIIQRQRTEKREVMLSALNDDRYTVFVAGLRRRIEKHDLALFSGPSANAPLFDASGKLLKKFLKKAVRAVDALDEESAPEALHAARKKVRRLRYGLDFLGSFHGRPANRLRKQAKLVQDLLGEHQDAIVAQDVLRSVIEALREEGTTDPETYVAIGQAIQRETRHAEAARAKFFAERKRFLKRAKKFDGAATTGSAQAAPGASDRQQSAQEAHRASA